MRKFVLMAVLLLVISCGKETQTLKEGSWRAVLTIDEEREIPFLMSYKKDATMTFINAEERVEITDIKLFGDSIYIEHPVFEGVFKGVFSSETINGVFIKPSLDRVMPFSMKFGNDARFEIRSVPNRIINGSWEMVFSPYSKTEKYIAKGIFVQTGNRITGTIRTTTGDYRYLDGVLVNDSLKLSSFDGAHAFLFEAKVTDSAMNGMFYSGNHFKEPFAAVLNNQYELPAADSLTFTKEGFDVIEFTFNDTEGNPVSLSDERFKNKVVLVQIMGTWCPNCLDETKYFTEFYKRLNRDDFEIVALAFEYAKTEISAMKSINKLKKSLGIPYLILLAQSGSSDKKKANEKLPMLNHILSYPTTIFIDKEGEIRRIHTGFNGPATGDEYIKFVGEFEIFINELLEEEIK
ncbi:MAG: thiol-disulfide isomerase/thioredoxin [Patiriisocius sp.]|jgi:thiol-disulfide isomerase/thioredoxin